MVYDENALLYSVKKGILSPASGNLSSILSSVSSCFVFFHFLVCVPFGSFLLSLQLYSFWNCYFHSSCPEQCLMNMTYLLHEFLSKWLPKSRNIFCDFNKQVLLITFSSSNFDWLETICLLIVHLLGPFTIYLEKYALD